MSNIITNKIFATTSSTIYFITLTTILLTILFYGNYNIYKTTKKLSAYLMYSTFILSVYIVFFGIHYFEWSLENIFILILIMSVLLSIVAFLLIYFSKSICADQPTETNYIGYVIIFLQLIVLYLGFHNRTQYTIWTWYDVIRFILALFIIRTIYFLTNKYNKPLYKTTNDISLALILYLYGTRLYKYNTMTN